MRTLPALHCVRGSDPLTAKDDELHEQLRKEPEPGSPLRSVMANERCGARGFAEREAALLPGRSRSGRREHAEDALHSRRPIERHLEAMIADSATDGERQRDEVTGIVIVMATLPRETVDPRDHKIVERRLDLLEREGEVIDQRTVRDGSRRAGEHHPRRIDAERRQSTQTLRVAPRGRCVAEATVREEDAMNDGTLRDLVHNPRRHTDFVVLMCENEKDVIRGRHER